MEDKLEDQVMDEITKMCIYYVQYDHLPEDIELEHLMISYDFITRKYKEITDLRKSFRLSAKYEPISNVGECLDSVTMGNMFGDLDNNVVRNLSREVTSFLKILEFCYHILDKIILERELNV